MGKFTDVGYKVLFDSTQCHIYDKDQLDRIFLTATRDQNNALYHVTGHATNLTLLAQSIIRTPDLEQSSVEPNPAPPPTEPQTQGRPTNAEIHLWHQCLGHLHYQGLYHMTSKKLVARLPTIPLTKHVYKSYMLGKLPRDRISKLRTIKTTRPL